MMGSTAGRPIPQLTEADEKRFWSKVALPNGHGCMEWTAATNGHGYGRFYLGGALFQAHRVAWTLAEGPIPAGLVLDHLCRNRACVNPLHLEVVNQRENVVRGEAPRVVGQWHREKTHCPAGHAYDEANTYHAPPNKRNPNGARICRACRREKIRAYRLRKRMASADSTGQLPMPTTSHKELDAS